MNITTSLYTSLRKPIPAAVREITWQEFCDEYVGLRWLDKARAKGNVYAEKAELPLWSPVKLHEGMPRSNQSVEFVSALCLDFDGTCTVEDVESVWAEWVCAIHTTWSHTAYEPHSRAIVLLSRPVNRKEHGQLIRWAMSRCEDAGLVPDPSCKDAARAWFMPCPSADHISSYNHIVYYEEDAPVLQVDEILSGMKVPELGKAEEHDTIFRDVDENEVGVLAWGESSEIGAKLKGYCPHQEDSSPGCAFLRRGKKGVILVCTSKRHGHERNPMKWYYQIGADAPRVTGTPDGGPEHDVLALCDQVIGKNGAPCGIPKSIHGNLYTILSQDTRWQKRIWEDRFRGTLNLDDQEWKDTDDTRLSLWVYNVYGCRFSSASVAEMVRLIGEENGVDPLVDYLESVQWDGQSRIERWLIDGLGCTNTSLHKELGKRWLIQAVARAMRPGCKADCVLILIGRQGAKKSTALRSLAGEDYFSDTPMDFGSANAYTQIRRTWIYEVAELDSIRKSAHSSVKAFLSAQQDTYRPAYGRHAVTIPRRVCFCGSTNETEFISDPTGSRRFWPAVVGSIDLTWVAENRDQLWAEALALFNAGEKWWLSDVHEGNLAEVSKQFESQDPWQELVLDWCRRRLNPFTVREVLEEVLRHDPHQMTKRAEMRVAEIIRKAGCKRHRRRVGTKRVNAWVFPKSQDEEEEEAVSW